MSSNLNKAYAAWKENPSEEAREALGSALLSRLQAITRGTNEDLVSETLLALWRNLESFDPGKKPKFETWVYQFVKNKRVEERRRIKMRRESPMIEAAIPVNQFKEIDRKLLVQQLLSRMSPEDRQLAELKLEGLSDQEITARIGKRPRWDHVKNRLKRLV